VGSRGDGRAERILDGLYFASAYLKARVSYLDGLKRQLAAEVS